MLGIELWKICKDFPKHLHVETPLKCSGSCLKADHRKRFGQDTGLVRQDLNQRLDRKENVMIGSLSGKQPIRKTFTRLKMRKTKWQTGTGGPSQYEALKMRWATESELVM